MKRYWVVPEAEDGRWGAADRMNVKRKAFSYARFVLRDEGWAAVHVYAGDEEWFDSSVDPLLTVRAK